MRSLEMSVNWTWSLTFTRYAMADLRLMAGVRDSR